MRTLAFLTLPLGVAGLKSNLVYFITFVLFSEVGLLGTGGGCLLVNMVAFNSNDPSLKPVHVMTVKV